MQINNYFRDPLILEILNHYEKIWAIRHCRSIASWDSVTYMPEAGGQERAMALAKTNSIINDFYLDKKFISLLAKASKKKKLTPAEMAIVRNLSRDIERLKKLPREFCEEKTMSANIARYHWEKAKKENNFLILREHLKKVVEATRREADLLGWENHPYDPLIDAFEEEWTTKNLETFFNEIRQPLKNLYDKILTSPHYRKPCPFVVSRLPNETDIEMIVDKIMNILGADWRRLRLDTSSHPFTTDIGLNDVRMTIFDGNLNFISQSLALLHEFGHALYDLQIEKSFALTPLCGGASMSIHESQSLFWEKIIGKNPAFIKIISNRLTRYFPEIDFDNLYFYMNFVCPDPVLRVDADEITYHFHIMLRFEMEKALIEGSLKVEDLPEAWRAKTKEYFKIEPANDIEGILQDPHWSNGSFGYFPAYSIGAFLSGMWKEAIEKDLGSLEKCVENGEIAKIKNWLGNKIHCYGKVFTSEELIKKVYRQNFSTKPLLNYLTEKYSKIYSLN